MIKKLAFGGLGLLLLASPVLASADQISDLQEQVRSLYRQLQALYEQTHPVKQPTGSGSSCLTFSNNLMLGSTDATTNGEVSKLQLFLTEEGVYPERKVTGYYGNLTAQAVMRWQKAHGMDFVTLKSGVGPMTRAKLSASCSGVTSCVNGPVQGANGLEAGVPVITSISPSSGPVGTNIKVSGCNLSGFEGDHYLTFERSDGAKTNLNPRGGEAGGQGTFITAVVAEPCQEGEIVYGDYSGKPGLCGYVALTPGQYKVSTTPWGKKSNEVIFTVTGSSQSDITILWPTTGDNWRIGEEHTVKLSAPVTATWPEGDKVVLNLIREDGSQAGIMGSLNNGSQTEFKGWTARMTLNYLGAGTVNKENTVTPGRYKIRISRGTDTLAESGVFTISN